jgi:zinc metalloprotease ZmpB
MPQEYDEIANAHIHRDDSGVVRSVLHAERLYAASARTPQLAAQEYLRNFTGLLGLEDAQLRALGLDLEETPTSDGVEYRLWSEKTQFDTTTVTFSQSYFGVPVWEAGVAVQMMLNPIRIIGAQSTAHADVSAERPSDQVLRRLDNLNEERLARSLGVSADDKRFHRKSLKIERRRFYVYRYNKDQRVRPVEEIPAAPARTEDAPVHRHHYPVPPLPPVPDEIVDGRHYVVAAIYFVLDVPEIPQLRWVALIEANTLAVLMLRALVASVDGLVFIQDPITTNGGPLPNASNAALNPLRSAALLKKLDPPAGGNYALVGDIVQLKDVEPPPIPSPIEPVGTDFNFNARTDNFAAVNAYYHADAFFRLVEEFGFDLNVYFGGTVFPTVVDHRGMGVTVNAHCLGNGAFGILQTTFALADLSNLAQPLGIACDQRVVLHELAGHGTLYNHVNGPNFGFAHSAGDSVGAVLNDPNSHAPDRFMTFPWLNSVANRRQDRTAAAGWGWSGSIALNPFGPLDIGGYNNEQILCTTHFRIYRSIGGDSTELAMREFAGRYVAYLILRTIGGLTQPTNPPNALTYASFLMAAELPDWTTAGQVGGCYWKVIRWAFEKQGLYQPVSMPKPNNNEGAPPPVDVYIDDGRHGEYMYGPANQYPYLQKFWETTDIWNRHEPDGHLQHQTPIVGRRNYAYVRVRNRGTLAAANVVVHGWHCRPSAGLVWPDDWKPMTTASRPIPNLPAGGQSVVGPFEWHPQHPGHECMLMSATVSGDLANNDPASGRPTAIGPTPLWRLVPCDNNLGLRAVIPVPGGGHRDALVEAFEKREVWASNPFSKTAIMEIRPVLPSFLASRGWTMLLDNPGGGSFSLGPRDSRRIRPRLVSGKDFTATELQLAGYVAIELIVLADGIVVGGLTFVLDPEMHHPAKEFAEEPRPEHRREAAEEEKERRDGEPRRIKLEIDLD